MKKINFLLLLTFGIISQVSAQDFNCDDFTDETWPQDEILGEYDTLGYTQDGIELAALGAGASGYFNGSEPGIYLLGPANFMMGGLDGSEEIARFEIYGWEEQYDEMGFAVNGSTIHYMDETFPLTIDGITVDLDDSAVDFDGWDNAYLTFTGNLHLVTIYGFESGILSLCTAPVEDDVEEGCDDFTLAPWPMAETFSEFDTLGYTQDGTQLVTVGAGGSCYMNDFQPGMYLLGPAVFSMDGSDQTTRFEIYGYYEQYSHMGFSVNGSATHYMDESFPMTIGSVTVDLDTSATNFDSWENAYLTFSGDLSEITIDGFESGILSLCTTPVGDELSVKEIEKSPILVYPNPAENQVNISADKLIANVTIYSISGQQVWNDNQVTNTTYQMDVTDFEKGFYTVNIMFEDGTNELTKLVVK